MRPHRPHSSLSVTAPAAGPPAPLTLLLVALLALPLSPRLAADDSHAGLRPPRGGPRGGELSEDDDGSAPGGLEVRWRARATTFFARLDEPTLPLRLVNRDPDAHVVAVEVLEDAGTMQSRRLGPREFYTVPARGSLEVPVRFAASLPDRLTHSGMVVAQITACSSRTGACASGASEPLFFHPQGRSLLVYGERLLCERFRCGVLDDIQIEAERGTWRVLGGGPLHGVPVQEEDVREDEPIVDGGDQ